MSRLVARRRAPIVVAVVIGVLLGLGGGAWAVTTLLRPPADVLASPGYTTVSAEQGTVGQSIRLNASAQWSPRQTLATRASGTVTSVEHTDGDRARPGDVLFHVDLRPVVVAEGAVPAFRDLSAGMTGDDVSQLQQFLAQAGFYTGEPSGRFTSGTTWAVREWQRSLGVTRDGVVPAGDLVYVPSLPARLALADAVAVGQDVNGPVDAVQVLRGTPSFTVSLSDGHLRLVQPGQQVELTSGDDVWTAEVTEIRAASESEPALAVLGPVGDGPVCADACGTLPVGEETLVPVTIEIVPATSGVTVPAGAVATSADGSTGVVLDDGAWVGVDVVAAASGAAVVDGLDAGTTVRVPGEAP